MIHILHGDNIEVSYLRLTDLIKFYGDHLLFRLTSTESQDDLFKILISQDLINSKRLIIVEEFLASGKIKDLGKIKPQTEDIIVFWEKINLPAKNISKFTQDAKIEQFRLPSQLFIFLDSLMPGKVNTFREIGNFQNKQEVRLTWHITNRVILLILASNKFTLEQVARITRVNIQNWQWQKILQQAQYFKLETLKKILSALIKIDMMLKTNRTNLEENTLLKILLLKYLKNS